MDTHSEILLWVATGGHLVLALFNLVLLWNLYQRRTPVASTFESDVLSKLENLQPKPPPTVLPVEVNVHVEAALEEGVFMAEQMSRANEKNGNALTNREKFFAALTHARDRLARENVVIEERTLGPRLEATIARLRALGRSA